MDQKYSMKQFEIAAQQQHYSRCKSENPNLSGEIEKLLLKLILDLGKCPNRKMLESESACLLVRALPAVQYQFLKLFSNKVPYNYCTKKIIGAFQSVFEKTKNLFPIVFLKCNSKTA